MKGRLNRDLLKYEIEGEGVGVQGTYLVKVTVIQKKSIPSIIPVHFANGIADDYGRKIQIFLFPILQVLITFLTGREKVKYCLTHSKTFLTDIQFNWMIDGVLLLVMFAEIWVIYASFA